MFSSALQNLSRLAIQESGVSIPEQTHGNIVEEVYSILEGMDTLTAEEMYVRPDQVAVIASPRLNKYLIEADDLTKFMITNNLDNIKDAIGIILEANDLQGQYHNVAIVIDEESILDEMQDLGYVVSDFNLKTPPKGLGLAMVGDQKDFSKIRNIANTKELMDLVTGRYGLPLIKRNYKSVGLLNSCNQESAIVKDEDAQIKVKKDDKVIHEDPAKKKNIEEVRESWMHPSLSERLGAKIRQLTGKSTLKDKLGRGLDKFGNAGTKWHKNMYLYGRQNPRHMGALAGMDALEKTAIAVSTLVGIKNGIGYLASGKKKDQNNTTPNNTNPATPNPNSKPANESVEELSPHDAHIQYLREVASGMHDEEDWTT